MPHKIDIDVTALDTIQKMVFGIPLEHDFLIIHSDKEKYLKSTCKRKAFQKCIELGLERFRVA